MSLSLAARRRTQNTSTSSVNKWPASYQTNSKSSSDILKQQQQLRTPATTIRKQKSFIESNKLISTYAQNVAARNYLSRGLSVGRSNDYVIATPSLQRAPPYTKAPLRKYSSIQFTKEHIETSTSFGQKIKQSGNITTAGGGIAVNTKRNSRQSSSIQAWSSTTSIFKSLDKELAAQQSGGSRSKDNLDNGKR